MGHLLFSLSSFIAVGLLNSSYQSQRENVLEIERIERKKINTSSQPYGLDFLRIVDGIDIQTELSQC